MKHIIPQNRKTYLYEKDGFKYFPIYRIEFDNNYSGATEKECLKKLKSNVNEKIKELQAIKKIIENYENSKNQTELF